MVIGSLVYVMNEGVMDKIKGGRKALKHKGHEDDTFGDDVIRRGATKIGDKLHLGGKGKTALGVAGHVGSIYAKGKAGAGGTLASFRHSQKVGNKIGRAIVKGSGKGIFYNADKKKPAVKK